MKNTGWYNGFVNYLQAFLKFFLYVAIFDLSNMKSLIFNTKRYYNFQLSKNKFTSLYLPTKLRTNEAENW